MLSGATMLSNSKPHVVKGSAGSRPGARPRPWPSTLHGCSMNCWPIDGEPAAEGEVLWADAVDSEAVERCGGQTSNDWEPEAGEAAGE